MLEVNPFGSLAWNEERPPDDAGPSDADLLATFETADRLIRPYREYIFATSIDICALHLDPTHEDNVLLPDPMMQT